MTLNDGLKIAGIALLVMCALAVGVIAAPAVFVLLLVLSAAAPFMVIYWFWGWKGLGNLAIGCAIMGVVYFSLIEIEAGNTFPQKAYAWLMKSKASEITYRESKTLYPNDWVTPPPVATKSLTVGQCYDAMNRITTGDDPEVAFCIKAYGANFNWKLPAP